MSVSRAPLTIAVLALLLWPETGAAEVIQLKCAGTNAGARYAKIEIDGKIYYADKFGKIAVPSIAAVANKSATIYSAGNQTKTVPVSPSGAVAVPCQ